MAAGETKPSAAVLLTISRRKNLLINEELCKSRVEFISYKNTNSSLCYGRLVLRISGKEYAFGSDSGDWPRFWESGGKYGFRKNYENPYIYKGEWLIDVARLPEKLQPYAHEIDAIFNANVERGCCGACL